MKKRKLTEEEMVSKLMKLSEKELIYELADLPGQVLFSLLEKYGIDLGPGWEGPHYEWEERANMAQALVKRVSEKELLKDLEESKKV